MFICAEQLPSKSPQDPTSNPSVELVTDEVVQRIDALEPVPVVQSTDVEPSTEPIAVILPETTLDDEIIEIIGKEPETSPEDLVLSQHIVSRWNQWLKSGLSKEIKEKILKKHSRTGKCSLEAPILNAEVIASLNDSAIKRDKYFAITQNLAGSALSAIGKVIEPLLDPKKEKMDQKTTLSHLWDVAQLVTEIHHSQTSARRAYIMPSTNKQVSTVLEKTVPDSYLFGEKLAEKIKEAKALTKVGQEMKTQPIPKKPAQQGNVRGPSATKPVQQTGYKSKFYRKNSQTKQPQQKNQSSTQTTKNPQTDQRSSANKSTTHKQ